MGVGTGMGTTYDVRAVRAHFPALAAGAAHFDGPGGSQVPDTVAAAVADTLLSPLANRGSVTAAERASDAIVLAARAAMGDLLGADPRGVVFGRSMTALTFDLARALAATWRAGGRGVVPRLRHHPHLRPRARAPGAAGATRRSGAFAPRAAPRPPPPPGGGRGGGGGGAGGRARLRPPRGRAQGGGGGAGAVAAALCRGGPGCVDPAGAPPAGPADRRRGARARRAGGRRR